MKHNILFLCTGNSARSILAEAICNHLADDNVQAFSAGSQPAGKVNPGAVEELGNRSLDASPYRSKSWDEFTAPGAPSLTWVITLCDNAADEVCPIFPGAYQRAHWGLPDPATGAASFSATFDDLHARIEALLAELD